MIGFLTGVAVNIVLGQTPDITGASEDGAAALVKAIDVLVHPSRIDWPSATAGVLAAGCASHTASTLTVAPSPVGVIDAASRSREIDS